MGHSNRWYQVTEAVFFTFSASVYTIYSDLLAVSGYKRNGTIVINSVFVINQYLFTSLFDENTSEQSF